MECHVEQLHSIYMQLEIRSSLDGRKRYRKFCASKLIFWRNFFQKIAAMQNKEEEFNEPSFEN